MGVTAGLISAGLGVAGSLLGSLSENAQKRQQADMQEAQAANLKRQADLQRLAADSQGQAIDARKIQLRREYEEKRGRNAVSLGTGNVDLSSGSAQDVALGNAALFAGDVAENTHQKALAIWEGYQKARNTDYEAGQLRASSDALNRSASNAFPTLLKAGLAGGQGFLSGYNLGRSWSHAGDAVKGGRFWDRALQKWQGTDMTWKH